MLVTPVDRKFGKYAPGDEFELPDRTAKVLVKVGKLTEVKAKGNTYRTRMLQAEKPKAAEPEEAPYGYKTDGTPRKRPGRPVKPNS